MFTSKMSWTRDVLSKLANKALISIRKYQKSFGFFAPDEIFELFDILVLHIL